MADQARGLTRRQVLIRGGLATSGAVALTLGVPGSAAPARTATEDFDAEVATSWFDLAIKLVRSTEGFTPPVASRAFAYAGLTLYEAVVGGSRDYASLQPLPDLPPLPNHSGLAWPIVANAALAEAFRLLFTPTSSANRTAIYNLEASLDRRHRRGAVGSSLNASVEHGRIIADQVFGWSTHDGAHEAHLNNFPHERVLPIGPGLWTPTPPGYSAAMQPTWGTNRCLALTTASDCPPGEPTPYSQDTSSQFFTEAVEVYETTETLSTEQSAIAWFWSDDPITTATPPGHLISIATQVLRASNSSLMAAAETYAKLGVALADSFIACWHAKYQYNLLRPVSFVRAQVDSHWLPLLPTPPFPEYPSGHSVQSGAGFTVLADLFGDGLPFTDYTHDERAMTPRHFDSFTHAAEEAAISRLYGGIHYRPAIEHGLEQGRCIGQVVNALPVRI